MWESDSEKTKLTLGIDKSVIKKAKAAGINISAITEQLLKAMTFEPGDDILYDDIIKSYKLFFSAIEEVLRKYNISLQIGERIEWSDLEKRQVQHSIFLDSLGSLCLWDYELERQYNLSISQALNDLYPVNQILNNLLSKLVEVTENSKQKLQELKFALKLLKTLSDEEPEKTD